MLSVAFDITFALLLGAVALALYRLFRGPSLPDRIIALDTLYVNTVALLLVHGIRSHTELYFEAVLLIAMLGFAGTCALAKFVLRGDIMD